MPAGNQIQEFHIIRHRTIKFGVQIAKKEQLIQRQVKIENELTISLNSPNEKIGAESSIHNRKTKSE